ncbi:MAG: hypothetical protein J5854_01775 [Clostridia bacterium]|nr:hypothetical protein [Clostridia bacterium]
MKVCVLDDKKVCDDCGECNRCDLDPDKICDNCCRCIAMEDEGNEFRSRIIPSDGSGLVRPSANKIKQASAAKKPVEEDGPSKLADEPSELTPELVDYWEKKLIEYGEAPADDGFGEIAVEIKNPVYGKRPARKRHGKD